MYVIHLLCNVFLHFLIIRIICVLLCREALLMCQKYYFTAHQSESQDGYNFKV